MRPAAQAALAAFAVIWLAVPAGRRRFRLSPRRSGLSRIMARRSGPTPRRRLGLTGLLARRPVPHRDRRMHRLVTTVLALALLVLFGMPWGALPAAAAVVVLPALLSRLEPTEVRRRRERIAAELPLAIDLLAGCLRAGRSPYDALAAVREAVGGPLADRLAEVEHRLRLGDDPPDAWSRLGVEPACAGVARAVGRAVGSGAPLADTLDHCATDLREQHRWTAEERARAVETRAVLPLGLCFLPAFVLIGVVPTVAGSLSGVLSGLGG